MWCHETISSPIQSMHCQLVVYWKLFHQSTILVFKTLYFMFRTHFSFLYINLQGEAPRFGCFLKISMDLSGSRNYHPAIILPVWNLMNITWLGHHQWLIIIHNLKYYQKEVLMIILFSRVTIGPLKTVMQMHIKLINLLASLLRMWSRLFFN